MIKYRITFALEIKALFGECYHVKNRMKKYQQLLKVMLPLLAILFTIGCGSDRKNSDHLQNESETVHLTYWPSSNPQEIILAKELVAAWNSDHADIQVKMQPLPASRSSEEVLMAAIAGKTTPDVCSNIWPGIMRTFVKAGSLVPFDQFPDALAYIERRSGPEVVEKFRSFDGKLYQVPWKGNPIVVAYNINRFREYGLEKIPRTYSEFDEIARKVTNDLDGDGQLDQWACYFDVNVRWWQRFFDFYPLYIAASGGKTLLTDGQVSFDDRAGRQVFRFFANGYKQGYFPRTSFQGSAFLQGRLAMDITGPWTIAYYDKNKPEGFEYGYFPVPLPDDLIDQVDDDPAWTFGDQKNIVIFATTDHPRESWQFIKHLLSAEQDLRLLEICSQLPLRKNLLADSLFVPFFEQNPMMNLFAEKIARTVGVDSHPGLQEMFDAISMEFDAACIQGMKDPDTALRDAAERCQEIIFE